MNYIKYLLIASTACALSQPASADFFIDVKPKKKPEPIIVEKIVEKIIEVPAPKKTGREVPEGFEEFSGNFEVVKVIGQGVVDRIDSFAENKDLKHAVNMIIPPNWVAYIKNGSEVRSNITYQAQNQPWTEVLKAIGVNYGYRFIVNHEQKHVQIIEEDGYKAQPDELTAEYVIPHTKKKLFVYTSEPKAKRKFVMVDGKPVEIVIK